MVRRCKSSSKSNESLPADLREALGRIHDLVLLLEPTRTQAGEANDFLVTDECAGSSGLLGVPPDSLRGASLSTVLRGTRFPLSLAACSWVALSGEDYVYEDDYQPTQGTTKRFAFRMTALPSGLLVTADDVTEERL